MKVYLFIISFLLIAAVAGCDDTTSSDNNANNINNINNSDCENPGGSAYDYIISDIRVPVSSSEQIGLDLDGDDLIDNKLGNLMQSLISSSPEFNINESIAASLAKGETVALVRTMVDDFSGDGTISSTFYEGEFTGDSTEILFNGEGTFIIDTESVNTTTLCGYIYGAGLTKLGPGNVSLRLYVSESQQFDIVLHHALVSGGTTSPTEWTDMIIAGAVDPEEIKGTIIPAFVDNINQEITNEPENNQFILDNFDGNCNAELPECAEIDDCIADGVITENELKCNQMIETILIPDVEIEGKSYVSVGIKVQAVRAIIE
ncbi:MAG: hypothetical protein PF689_06690 [Deltaproteobacteria bacterium]|jgi:hypothetical protein|nr:hypothetical protein [Deltaproteobacteria bacterium]